MDGPSKDISPAPSTSTKGFKGVVAKARLGRNRDDSTISLNGSDEGTEQSGIRNSVDSLVDKVREGRNASLDDGLPPGPSNLSKLIPGRVKKKRKKREEAEQLQQEITEGRGRSVEDQPATAAQPRKLSKDNRSRSTLDGDGGSLITIDSEETESPSAPLNPTTSPPPLVSHQSHVGYLTSSSPLIKTTIAPDTPEDLESISDVPEFNNPQYRKSSTFAVADSTPSLPSNLAPQHASTMDTREGRSLGVADGNRSRGVSPGAKIKDVFSRKKNSSPPKSPDRVSALSDTNGNGIGALFGKDKRGSVNPERTKDANPKSPTASIGDLPSIITAPKTPTTASLEAPETHVTPPTPTDHHHEPQGSPSLNVKASNSAGTNTNTVTSPSGNMISHRRVRSDSASHAPSKLSNAMSAPLTSMIEESKTPGAKSPGTQGSPGGAGGFFSSVFSAAQNAATQFSSTMTSNQPRSRSSTQASDVDGTLDSDAGTTIVTDKEDLPVGEEKKLAVDTLGTGDLSLSHLGIGTDNSSTNSLTNISSDKSKDSTLTRREEADARAEKVSAARAVSQAYSEKPVEDSTSTPVVEDVVPGVRPRSTYEASIMTGDKTPPNGSLHDGDHTFRRSGSVRSRVGTIAKRHRNSSSATGGTISAALAAGHAGLANPSATGSSPKLTGFAVASKKRNRDFHNLFRTVPEDDYLIEDYSCALQRDIILAGRIYVSEGHICFSSNILGWVTTLIINFDEIVSVEKENTAMVFPNAIAIQTLHARHTFRSLLSREATYDLLIGIWKINHPSLKSSLNGVRLDQGGTGDKTEKFEPIGDEDNSDVTEEEEEFYDEDEEDDEGTGSFTEVPEGSIGGSEILNGEDPKTVARKVSAMGVAVGAAAGGVPTPSDAKAGEKAAAASAVSVDFPGPATHAPTECNDVDSHYDKFLKDDIVPAPLGKVYSMVFGPASGGFMAKWLLDEVKCTDLQMEDDKKGLSEENRVRTFSYIKPLYASIGPKSTKCVVTETLDFIDLEQSISVTASTQTPDVPSGNVFATKTRFCFMWAPGNATRVVMNFNIEWTGKSWLKGPIEKGAADGQKTYGEDLIKALKAGVSTRPRAGTVNSKIKKGKRRKGDTGPAPKTQFSEKPTSSAQQQDSSWGLLEPLHGIFGPVVDIFSPMISANMIIGFLLFIIIFNWLRGPKTTSSNSLGYPGMSTPQRIAAYEEIWRKEESDLWNWLEERVGMQGIAYPDSSGDQEAVAKARRQREQSLRGKGMRKKLADVKMSGREVDHAIRVTEERLDVLKRAVEEKKGAEMKEASVGRSDEEGSRPV